MLDYFEGLEIYVGKVKVLILKVLFSSILLATVLFGSMLQKIIDNVIVEWSIVITICLLAVASILYMIHLEKLRDKIIKNRGNEKMELKKIINVRVFSIDAEELEALKSQNLYKLHLKVAHGMNTIKN